MELSRFDRSSPVAKPKGVFLAEDTFFFVGVFGGIVDSSSSSSTPARSSSSSCSSSSSSCSSNSVPMLSEVSSRGSQPVAAARVFADPTTTKRGD
jgi:hypothetical protein